MRGKGEEGGVSAVGRSFFVCNVSFLFEFSVGLVRMSEHWFLSRDGEETVRLFFDRHYSRRFYKDGRKPKLFVGPGEKMVLVDVNCLAIFIWRKFICDVEPPQIGINCAVFRNESGVLSSILIREACVIAEKRWPNERHWTLVNSKKIQSRNPGFCFIKAGWKRETLSKTGLVILSNEQHRTN